MAEDWISANEALARLGVRPQTLYAYVSRGRLRMRPDPGDPRRSLYRAGDVDGLRQRKARSRKPAEVARAAIAWGEPVLPSAITTVVDGRLYYRGRDAVELSKTHTWEGVARNLRGGEGLPQQHLERPRPPAGRDPTARLFAALAQRAAVAPSAQAMSAAALAVEAATLLDVVADAVAGQLAGGATHSRLATAWGHGPRDPAADLIRQALVLLADHELNASTFTARVAASTGASLAASALAGLSALSGPRHGGAAEAMRAFALEAQRASPEAAIARRRRLDEGLPGFGHPLYPDGDPRAAALLETLPVPAELAALRRAVAERTGLAPNIDFALAAMAQTLRLPRVAPFALFAVGRSAGWIAHALEQGATGELIRPRARYVGVAVG